MRIAHVVWSLGVGGLETMLVDIVNRQVREHDVMLVVINSIHDKGVLNAVSEDIRKGLISRPPGSRNLWYPLKLNLLLRWFKPNVIHAHQESIIRLLKTVSAKKVLTVHAVNTLVTRTIRGYDRVFAISETVRQDLLNRTPSYPSVVVPNGIDFGKIPCKNTYGSRPFRIVQISRLAHEEKGQDVMLHALREVVSTDSNDVTVDFIGGGASLPYLQKLAKQLKVEKNCRFVGSLPRREIYQLLPSYDLLVQPSRFEGFGLTVVEAMAAAVPVLVSDIEAPMDIIGRGRYGYSFRAGDGSDCARAIRDAMASANDRLLVVRLIEARDYAKKRFDVLETAAQYCREYVS